jgi:sugar (pentulose or hexulose) kinase
MLPHLTGSLASDVNAKAKGVWSQIKADINNVTLETVKSVKAACLGAAILAGTAVGIFDGVENAVDSMFRADPVSP